MLQLQADKRALAGGSIRTRARHPPRWARKTGIAVGPVMAIEAELQAQVDAQLMEQGAFAPLDLLFTRPLDLQRLRGVAASEVELLDDVLMGDPAKILAELEQAATYARNIRLVEQPQDFLRGGRNRAQASPCDQRPAGPAAPHRLPLPACTKRTADGFVLRQSRRHLDQRYRAALCARNATEGQRQLDRLYVQAPIIQTSPLSTGWWVASMTWAGLLTTGGPTRVPDRDRTHCPAPTGVGLARLPVAAVAASGGRTHGSSFLSRRAESASQLRSEPGAGLGWCQRMYSRRTAMGVTSAVVPATRGQRVPAAAAC